MAMVCINGSRECTGCMNCLDEEVRAFYCPVCGKKIYEDSAVYIDKRSDDIIGCARCIRVADAEDVADRF